MQQPDTIARAWAPRTTTAIPQNTDPACQKCRDCMKGAARTGTTTLRGVGIEGLDHRGNFQPTYIGLVSSLTTFQMVAAATQKHDHDKNKPRRITHSNTNPCCSFENGCRCLAVRWGLKTRSKRCVEKHDVQFLPEAVIAPGSVLRTCLQLLNSPELELRFRV